MFAFILKIDIHLKLDVMQLIIMHLISYNTSLNDLKALNLKK